jgi:hypothetical protein
MTEIIVNSEASLQWAIGELRELFKTRKYFSLKPKFGKGRTVDQNSISHAWYAQVARELREDNKRGVKRFCKLHFGVPILRAEDDEFREAYDSTVRKALTYEQKLVAMDMLPVTSRMTTKQLSEYMVDVQDHYRARGVQLLFPEPEREAA